MLLQQFVVVFVVQALLVRPENAHMQDALLFPTFVTAIGLWKREHHNHHRILFVADADEDSGDDDDTDVGRLLLSPLPVTGKRRYR